MTVVFGRYLSLKLYPKEHIFDKRQFNIHNVQLTLFFKLLQTSTKSVRAVRLHGTVRY